MPEGNPFWPEDPQAGDILPLARGKDGHLHLAAPNALRGAVNQLVDFAQLPDDVYHGRVGSNSDLTQRTNAGALSLLGLGAGLPAEEGALKIFGGVSARGANLRKLRNAAAMELKGADPQSIWTSTGWYRAPDQQWRFEIPDTDKAQLNLQHFGKMHDGIVTLQTKLDKDGNVIPYKLGDILDHPSLYEHYPDLKEIKVLPNTDPFYKGWQNEERNEIGLAPETKENVLSTLLHETQHAVQGREGFARGGNPRMFWGPTSEKAYHQAWQNYDANSQKLKFVGAFPLKVATILEKVKRGVELDHFEKMHLNDLTTLHPTLMRDFSKSMDEFQKQHLIKQKAYDTYGNIAGEVEARNVQARFGLPGSEEVEPGFTSGTSSTGQILIFPDRGMTYAGHAVDHDPFASVAVQPVEHNPFEQQVVPVDHDPFQVEKENE